MLRSLLRSVWGSLAETLALCCSPTPDTVMMSCVWRALGGAVGLEGSALTRVTFFFFLYAASSLARQKVEKAPFFLTSSNTPAVCGRAAPAGSRPSCTAEPLQPVLRTRAHPA